MNYTLLITVTLNRHLLSLRIDIRILFHLLLLTGVYLHSNIFGMKQSCDIVFGAIDYDYLVLFKFVSFVDLLIVVSITAKN